MNAAPYLTSQNLCGVYEMDIAGTVLYHKARAGNPAEEPLQNLKGRNFFDELAHLQNFTEFQRHFKYFVSDSHSTNEFKISFQFDEQILESRVKLVRVSERENNVSSSLFIVDIRQA